MFYTVRDRFSFSNISSEKPLVRPLFLSDSGTDCMTTLQWSVLPVDHFLSGCGIREVCKEVMSWDGAMSMLPCMLPAVGSGKLGTCHKNPEKGVTD